MDRREFLSAISTAVGMTAIPSSAYAAFQDRGIVRYPDPWIETIDSRFTKLYRPVGTTVERLYTGSRWAEGPVWFGSGRYLLWSDISNNRILRWVEETGAVSVFRSPSNYCNGNTRDLQGRLITCERRRVTAQNMMGLSLL
jgi:gluconolactonase